LHEFVDRPRIGDETEILKEVRLDDNRAASTVMAGQRTEWPRRAAGVYRWYARAFPNDPGCSGGLEREDHVIRNVRLIGHRLKAFVHVAADLRGQATPKARRAPDLCLGSQLPTGSVS